MRTLTTKQKLLVAGVGAAVLSTSGVAFAYWSTGGGGTGSATTSSGSTNQLEVTDNSSSLTAMFPGDAAQTITATVTNKNASESYHLATLKAYLTIDETHATDGCTIGDYMLNGVASDGTAASPTDLGITATDLIHGATATKTFTLHFNNKTDTLQNACKGAVVTIHYVAA